ncbi:DUF1284 domain-containing protein [Thermodesulfovibrionales bacterium]|nr:DUF1284 domain-containing protein [Thermodesulfovibrionales bacterium]
MATGNKDRPCLEIRAHHLLCLLNFRGLGYSDEFVQNIRRVSAAAFAGGTVLRVVDRCDAICVSCPHKKGSECAKREDSVLKVQKQDQMITIRLGITIGDELGSEDIWTLVKDKICPLDLHWLCHGCEWLAYCLSHVTAKMPSK